VRRYLLLIAALALLLVASAALGVGPYWP